MLSKLAKSALLTIFLTTWLAGTAFAAQTTTLQFWTPMYNAAVQKWLQDTAIPAFQAENPGIKVEVYYGSWSDWNDKLTIAYATGTFPDVYAMHTEAPIIHTRNGWAAPLDSYLQKWNQAKDYIPVALEGTKINGKQYGVPWSVQGPIMMMRRSVAQEVGLNDSVPATWEEFRTAARRMVKFKDNTIIRAGYTRPTDQYFLNWVHTAGGDLFTPDLRQPLINSPQAVEALSFLVEVMQTVQPPSYTLGPVNFADGTVAMREFEPTYLGDLAITAPTVIPDVAVGLPPRQARNAVRVYLPNLAMGSQSKQKDLAWRWIEFLERPDNLLQYNILMGRLSPRLSHLRHEYLNAIPQRRQALELYSQYGIPNTVWPYEFNLMRTSLSANINKAFDGTISPKEALDEVARSWQVDLNKVFGTTK